jgi:hypothetical protein
MPAKTRRTSQALVNTGESEKFVGAIPIRWCFSAVPDGYVDPVRPRHHTGSRPSTATHRHSNCAARPISGDADCQTKVAVASTQPHAAPSLPPGEVGLEVDTGAPPLGVPLWSGSPASRVYGWRSLAAATDPPYEVEWIDFRTAYGDTPLVEHTSYMEWLLPGAKIGALFVIAPKSPLVVPRGCTHLGLHIPSRLAVNIPMFRNVMRLHFGVRSNTPSAQIAVEAGISGGDGIFSHAAYPSNDIFWYMHQSAKCKHSSAVVNQSASTDSPAQNSPTQPYRVEGKVPGVGLRFDGKPQSTVVSFRWAIFGTEATLLDISFAMLISPQASSYSQLLKPVPNPTSGFAVDLNSTPSKTSKTSKTSKAKTASVVTYPRTAILWPRVLRDSLALLITPKASNKPVTCASVRKSTDDMKIHANPRPNSSAKPAN